MWFFNKANKVIENTEPRHPRMREYEAGVLAGKVGAESWENPHCSPDGGKSSFAYWEAGRCFGMQQRKQRSRRK